MSFQTGSLELRYSLLHARYFSPASEAGILVHDVIIGLNGSFCVYSFKCLSSISSKLSQLLFVIDTRIISMESFKREQQKLKPGAPVISDMFSGYSFLNVLNFSYCDACDYCFCYYFYYYYYYYYYHYY